MNIGIVLSSTPAYSETFLSNKIRFLKEAGHNVILYTEYRSLDFDLCPCRTGYSGGWGFHFILAVLRIISSPIRAIRLWKQNRLDGFNSRRNIRSLLINSHILKAKLDWLHFGFATMTIGRENIAKVIGAKMAASIRGYDIAIYPLKHPDCYSLLWKRLTKLHYISDDLLTLAELNGLDKTRIQIEKITPAIGIQLFQKTSKRQNPKIHIATIARLHWKKGIEYTLEALSKLKKSGIDFEYHIIGEGPEYERLIFATHQFNLAENTLFRGKIPHEKIPSILAQTDLYIQYSIQEGFGNSVLEAQAMGCICIVSDAEGLSENVINNQTGFVVNKRNPDKLFQAILNAIHLNEEQKDKMISSASKRVREEFNLSKQQQAFLQFYS